MTTFTGTPGTDTFIGADNVVDVFDFDVANLTGVDTVNGGTGLLDLLRFTTAGTIAAAALANVSHIETVMLANGANQLSLTDALVGSSDNNHILLVLGGAGDDTIDASAVTTATDRVSFRPGSGNDVLTGGAGNDLFYLAPADLSSSDTINGASGYDNIGFTAPGTISAAALSHVSGIEAITLANGANSIALTDALASSAIANILTVNGGAGDDIIDASAVTTATNRVIFRPGAGNDVLTGGAGNDVFEFALANLDSNDRVSGGTGTDRLQFTSAGTIAAGALAHVAGVEMVTLANGANSLALTDALVGSADNHIMAVNGGTGNDTIDASAVTTPSNRVFFNSGAGADILIGGEGSDVFEFAATNLDSTDYVSGGAGINNLVFLTAGTIGAAAFTHVSDIEAVTLANGANNVTLTDALVGGTSSQTLTVNGSTGDDTVDASRVFHDVLFPLSLGNDTLTGGAGDDVFYPGAGNDTLAGGAGNDLFNFAPADLSSADTVAGGAGNDTLILTVPGTVAVAAFTHVGGVETIDLANGTNHLTLTDALVGSANNHTLTVNGGTGSDTIDASAVTSPTSQVIFVADTQTDIVNTADTLIGGAGNDTFIFGRGPTSDPYTLTSADTVAGGAGSDTLFLASSQVQDVSASDLAHVTGIETVQLYPYENPGFQGGDFFLSDAMVGSATDHTVTVIGGENREIISAAAVTTAANSVIFEGGGDGDLLTAGAGADIFRYTAVSDSSGDFGGGGGSFDRIVGFNAAADKFDLPDTAVNKALGIAHVDSGELDTGVGSEWADSLAASVGQLGAHQAVLFHVTAGDYSGHDFLIVNPNDTAGYVDHYDFMFDITGYSGTLTTNDFI